MAKFEVLKLNRLLMLYAGIHSNNLHEPTNEFFRSKSAYYIVCNLIVGLTANLLLMYNSPDFSSMIRISYVALGTFQAFCLFVSVGIRLKDVKKLHLEMQAIIDEGKYQNDSRILYTYVCRTVTDYTNGIESVFLFK